MKIRNKNVVFLWYPIYPWPLHNVFDNLQFFSLLRNLWDFFFFQCSNVYILQSEEEKLNFPVASSTVDRNALYPFYAYIHSKFRVLYSTLLRSRTDYSANLEPKFTTPWWNKIQYMGATLVIVKIYSIII